MNREDVNWVAGTSRAVRDLENIIAEIAPTNLPVLFVGESGTGKEMFANRVHRLSQQSDKPMVRISCASMNPTSFFSELGLNPNDQ